MDAFFSKLSPGGCLALKALATQGRELRLEEIRALANLGTVRDASLMLLKCGRIAKKYGLDWGAIVSFRIVGARKERTSVYKAGPLLLGEAA